jgi:alanine dehydrogenase
MVLKNTNRGTELGNICCQFSAIVEILARNFWTCADLTESASHRVHTYKYTTYNLRSQMLID